MKRPTPCLLEALESRIAPATFVVSTLKDTTDDAHDTGSLRDAISLANANAAVGGDTIVFQTMVHGEPAPLHGKIVLRSSLPEIVDDVSISGPVAGKASDLVIDLNGHAGPSFAGENINLSDLTITKGRSNYGGGLYIGASGVFKITDVTISKNRAVFTDDSPAVMGGGICIVENSGSAEVDIVKSKITGNVAAGRPGTKVFAGGQEGAGGGIYCGGTQEVNLSITESVVSGNIARGGNAKSDGGLLPMGGSASGGGIESATHCNLTVSDSHISGNEAIAGNGGSGAKGDVRGWGGDAFGGGIDSGGYLLVMDSVISANSARAGRAGPSGSGTLSSGDGSAFGGGLSAGSRTAETMIEKSIISGNLALGVVRAGLPSFERRGDGGGISSGQSPLTISESTISGNQAVRGGGIYSGPGETLTISQSTIANNLANEGGGVSITGGLVTISECTLALNHARDSGGALSATGAGDGSNSTVKIENDTISGNRAGLGGGIFEGAIGGFEIISTIISGNAAPGGADVVGEIDASFDLIGKVSFGLVFDTDTSNLKNVNPQLSTLGLHGGLTETMLPSKLSPVIDQGSNPDGSSEDQRGETRELGVGVDIGAVEVQ